MRGQNSEENRKELVQFYDEYVSRQKSIGVNERHHSIIRILKSIGLKSSNNVLELGCGIGTFTSLLVKEIIEGKIISADISGKSIEEAKRTLGSNKHVEFIHADVTEYDFGNEKFDVIVLCDVLEHIPMDLHEGLFKKMSSLIDDKGFVFIHIPNPYYLEWCYTHRPEMLQIIDQPITTDHLTKVSYPHNFYIDQLKTYSIWVVEGDYQYIVFRKNIKRDFGVFIEEKISFMDKVKFKLNAIFK